jgi:16S rRNA (cytosine967-C5)-methyltransferase
LLKDAWKLAIETLGIVELQKLSERLALARISKQLGIDDASTIRFAYGLVVETVRRKNLIAEFIHSVLRPKKLSDFRLDVSAFLQLYVYQTRVAKNWGKIDFAEATRIVGLARAILGWQTLRGAERYLGFLLTRPVGPLLAEANDEQRVALCTFQPAWFVKYCFNLLGRHEALEFLESSIYPPPVCIRFNTLKAPREAILKKLESEGAKLSKIEPLRDAHSLVQTDSPLKNLSSFRNGLFFVQDKASCYAVEIANPTPGLTVLDACAAPGAKTTYIAQFMQNRGKIYSLDYSVRRLKSWKQEVNRMGVNIAEPVVADARGSIPLDIGADLVVLDPPCTSTGVFGRQPSAKWRLTSKSIESMAAIQWQMISNVSERVKQGGALVYCTCSVTVEENEMIIERFLKRHPDFHLMDLAPKLGMPGLRGLIQCRRLFPHLHDSNGFFIAKLVKL